MRMKSGWALALAIASLGIFNSCSSSKNAITGTGIVWVATTGDQMITTFTINESTGASSQVGSATKSGAQPSKMLMTVDRKVLFVANMDVPDPNCDPNHTITAPTVFCNEVRAFSVNTDGTLKAIGNPVVMPPPAASAQGSQIGLAVDPKGSFLFVTNQGNSGAFGQAGAVQGSISVLSISSSGLTLSSSVSSAVPGDFAGNGPSDIAVAPVGNFLYVSNRFDNTVAAFSYDPSTGTITTPPFDFKGTGTNPAGVAFSKCAGGSAVNTNCTASDGDNLFVANSGLSNNISVFSACIEVTPMCPGANGTLQEISGSPFPANGIGPTSFIVDPLLNFVYVVDTQSNEISQFKYSPATGALTALSPATVSTGPSPAPGGITSDGSFVMVPDSGASQIDIFRVNNTASSTGASATGRLSRPGTASITLAAQPTAAIVR
jgi:6-phosphogluconolactonase (cycloisomerase 2 family)